LANFLTLIRSDGVTVSEKCVHLALKRLKICRKVLSVVSTQRSQLK
jgi:hypothetical protein